MGLCVSFHSVVWPENRGQVLLFFQLTGGRCFRVLRVTGGEARGRRIRSVSGRTTRPTADRIRVALFNILGSKVNGARVLDLFAGSGSLGIEALSRGAASAIFVEKDRNCVLLIRRNLAELGYESISQVRQGDVVSEVKRLGMEGVSFDIIFLDPPYAAEELIPALLAVSEAGVMSRGCLVVAEHSSRKGLPSIPSLNVVDRRVYGDTALSFFEKGGVERG